MEGLFYKKLYLFRDDDDKILGVTMCGPITWEADETSASIEATVSQGTAKAHGHTLGDVVNPHTFWMFTGAIEGDVAPEKGPATATAKALVRVGDSTETVEWETQVELI